MFILIWINDSFAYLIGSNFGRQNYLKVSHLKKQWKVFLGGVFFSAIGIILFSNTQII